MTEILEKGDVHFAFWPARGADEPDGLQDVQRFFLVLKPEGQDAYRRLVVGQKKLPEPDGGERRYWGFVDRVAEGSLDAAFERGEDNLDGPDARRAGEGRYAIARHDGHTDLVYALERADEAIEGFNLEKQASYLLTIKNPDVADPPGTGLERDEKARFPRALRDRFGDRRWTSADPPAFLDHEGAEFLLVGGRDERPSDLDLRL